MNTEPVIAVLFARRDSIYKQLPGTDVWDADRDARLWPGGTSVVTHPPCRLWGRLHALSTAPKEERELALIAIDQVRQWGGALEHPAGSALWPTYLPLPGSRDQYGGWTLPVCQWWWGHKAEKATRLYICGVEPSELPEIPFKIGEPTHVIAQSSRRQRLRLRPEVTKREREATPPEFAKWLLALARKCKPKTGDVHDR